MSISELICEQLKVEGIDFTKPANFVKLLDLIFKFKKCFKLIINRRTKNFVEDTLNIIWDELDEAMYEHPLQVKEFICIVKNEYWEK
ncbi:hypothetical protein IJ541_10820 [bacterium]|nr:hypothetical protein [bacterium]